MTHSRRSALADYPHNHSCSLTFAFGWVLGQFFLVALIAGVGSWWIVRRELRIERREWVNDRAGGGAGLIEKRRSRRGRKSETIVV